MHGVNARGRKQQPPLPVLPFLILLRCTTDWMMFVIFFLFLAGMVEQNYRY